MFFVHFKLHHIQTQNTTLGLGMHNMGNFGYYRLLADNEIAKI